MPAEESILLDWHYLAKEVSKGKKLGKSSGESLCGRQRDSLLCSVINQAGQEVREDV